MTRGVVLIAQNNEEIDYVKLAICSANRIKQFLNVPVAIITNSLDDNLQDVFDTVIVVNSQSPYTKFFYDGDTEGKRLSWHNVSRADVYDLTPFDETLVIDVDYVINSDTLTNCWHQPLDFLIYQKSIDLAYWRDNKEFEKVSDYSIDFYWATVFFFRKTQLNKTFFTLIKEIRSNWDYYKLLYQIHSTNFRNDLAFSIGIHMLNGFSRGFFAGSLPGKMFFTTDRDILLNSSERSMHFLLENNSASGGFISVKTNDVDVHVMNKYSLLRALA
jgi:hypothetical protein